MAKEGFFKIDLDLKKVRELLKDFVVSFNEEYDEIRLNGQKCCSKVVQSLILSTFAAI